jgi:hypothetical protein
MARGDKYEDTANPCIHGHTPTIRYAASGNCIACVREQNAAVPHAVRESYTAKGKAKRYAANPTRDRKFIQTLNLLRADSASRNDTAMVALIDATLAYKQVR